MGLATEVSRPVSRVRETLPCLGYLDSSHPERSRSGHAVCKRERTRNEVATIHASYQICGWTSLRLLAAVRTSRGARFESRLCPFIRTTRFSAYATTNSHLVS